MRTIKHFGRLVGLSAALLILTAPTVRAGAFEVDVDYEGPLDTVTGEPVYMDSENGAQSDQVWLSDNLMFDSQERAYIYTVNGFQIISTIVDGMIAQGTVSIIPEEGVRAVLYRNGEELTDQDLTSIGETGEYVLEAVVGGQSSRVLTFTIVGESVGSITGYTMPDGFVVTNVTLDGQETNWNRSYVDLSAEGDYVINYKCARAGTSYELDVYVDHTPPTLTLEGIDEDDCARGPVTILDVEEGVSVAIQHNGEWGSYQQKLTESGEYRIYVVDEAGNSTDYYFTILIYFNSSSFIFIGLLLSVFVATGVYLWLSRKRLRVR